MRKLKRTLIQMSPELLSRVKEQARHQETSLAGLVRLALVQYLDRAAQLRRAA